MCFAQKRKVRAIPEASRSSTSERTIAIAGSLYCTCDLEYVDPKEVPLNCSPRQLPLLH
jgi:hypothetical protein